MLTEKSEVRRSRLRRSPILRVGQPCERPERPLLQLGDESPACNMLHAVGMEVNNLPSSQVYSAPDVK